MSLEKINLEIGKLITKGFCIGEHMAFIHGICKGNPIQFKEEEMNLSIHERTLIAIRITSSLIQNAGPNTLKNISSYLSQVNSEENRENRENIENGEN